MLDDIEQIIDDVHEDHEDHENVFGTSILFAIVTIGFIIIILFMWYINSMIIIGVLK